jgi:hypothetical protein
MDSSRKKSGRISDSANPESVRIESGRKEPGKMSTQVKSNQGRQQEISYTNNHGRAILFAGTGTVI